MLEKFEVTEQGKEYLVSGPLTGHAFKDANLAFDLRRALNATLEKWEERQGEEPKKKRKAEKPEGSAPKASKTRRTYSDEQYKEVADCIHELGGIDKRGAQKKAAEKFGVSRSMMKKAVDKFPKEAE